MERVLGIILAGGRGRRMDLLCYLRPKPTRCYPKWVK
jgi:molybdopterin-guanine dinucleotide biosynthesis protein A